MSLSSLVTKTQTVAVKTANPGVKSHWWKDTWQKPVLAGTRPRWCSSLLRPESRCSRARLSDRPQSQPLWNLPATETRESSAMLRAKRGIVKFTYMPYIQHGISWRVCDWKVMIQLGELDVFYLPNVSTSVMHFVSSCRSMSLGTVSGLLSMWPLYFLRQRGQSSKIKNMQQG